MSDKIEVTKIKIQLKGQHLELTAEEARQVYAELDKLLGLSNDPIKDQLATLKRQFEAEKKFKPEKEIVYIPIPANPAPIIIERWPTSPYGPHSPPWTVWSGTTPGPTNELGTSATLSIDATTVH
jgi:hypothetical protein